MTETPVIVSESDRTRRGYNCEIIMKIGGNTFTRPMIRMSFLFILKKRRKYYDIY